ncbi:hypothetical protein LCGC14_2769480 [marine sediment metagenome]|uniref:Uncharacterized protein n=1 Tax=marine sediment metagenome TaxID=412755 RepID=A0A0F9B5D5_9ZZZZ
MSLRLKGRKVTFNRNPRYEGKAKIVKGKISQSPIWLKVVLEDGEITTVEQNNLYFVKGKK